MKKNARIVISRNPDKLIALAKDILDQHTQLGSSSLLNSLDMTLFQTLLAKAEAENDAAKKLYKQAEKVIQQRNNVLGLGENQNSSTPGTLLFLVTSVRDVLLGHSRGEEQKLGDYGFIVDRSSRRKPGEDGLENTAPPPADVGS